MNIYLAGKIDDKFGSWRDHFFRPYDYWEETKVGWTLRQGHMPDTRTWMLDRTSHLGAREFSLPDQRLTLKPWPTESNTLLLGAHSYSGPYRQRLPEIGHKMRGDFHGSQTNGMHGMMESQDMDLIVNQCKQAIERSDILFVYINSPDCYGTIAEIGYAHALGKFIYVVEDYGAKFDHGDFWFIEELANEWRTLGEIERGLSLDERSDERNCLIHHLRNAVFVLAAKGIRPQELRGVMPPVTQHGSREIAEARRSFDTIARWSSDPRVRDEAMRMARELSKVSG